MSITLAVAPTQRFKFSRQPIAVECSTNSLIETAGVKFARTITFISAPITAGVVFEITWNDIIVHMESETGVLTRDGLHYRAKDIIGETLADWIEHFAEDIGANFDIARDFEIAYTTTTLTLTARFTGADYNITFTDIPGTLTTDYTLGSETTGVTEVIRENFKMFVDVYFDDTDYVRIGMFRTDKSATGYYEAQIQKAIHSKITSPFPSLTNVDDVMILEPGELIRKFWIRYFEFYGETAAAAYYYLNTNSGNYYYAVMGGHYMNKAQTFLSDYEDNFQFLTWQKRTKYVTRDQPEWLYWFVANGDSLYGNLRLTIIYTDASTTVVNYPWDIAAEDELRAMYKAVGYFQIVEPNIASGKTVARWTIQIIPTDEVTPFTTGETFTYYPITDGTPWYQHIAFRNSFGGYDTYRCSGEFSTGLDITGEVFNQWLDDDYLQSDGEFANAEFNNQLTHRVSVNFTDQETLIDYLREIFVYPKAAIVAEDTDADDGSVIAIPIVILPGSIAIKKSSDMLYSFEFGYSQAFNDKGIHKIVS